MAKGLFAKIMGKVFTSRQAPKQATTQAKAAHKAAGGTKALAQEMGVTERTVQRWLKGDRTPKGKDAAKLEELAAKAQTTERGRERKAKTYAAMGDAPSGVGVTVNLSGVRMGGPGGSDIVRAGRSRPPLSLQLTGEQVAELLEDPTSDNADAAIQQALGEYFRRPPGDFDYDLDAIH